MVIGLAALMLSACGGGSEVYPVPASQAYQSLSGVGTPNGMSPLPGGLQPVTVSFEALPGDNMVQWKFSHEGDDLARIVAQVTPDGDNSSNVTVAYVEGDAPGDKWRNGKARELIKRDIQRLLVEAVDAKLENRSINEDLRKEVVMTVTQSSIGSMMGDASKAMDEAVARQEEDDRQQEADRAANPYNATRPSTDLRKYNN
jgi:hypothetical protein